MLWWGWVPVYHRINDLPYAGTESSNPTSQEMQQTRYAAQTGALPQRAESLARRKGALDDPVREDHGGAPPVERGQRPR